LNTESRRGVESPKKTKITIKHGRLHGRLAGRPQKPSPQMTAGAGKADNFFYKRFLKTKMSIKENT
jgi:hypothetical protein